MGSPAARLHRRGVRREQRYRSSALHPGTEEPAWTVDQGTKRRLKIKNRRKTKIGFGFRPQQFDFLFQGTLEVSAGEINDERGWVIHVCKNTIWNSVVSSSQPGQWAWQFQAWMIWPINNFVYSFIKWGNVAQRELEFARVNKSFSQQYPLLHQSQRVRRVRDHRCDLVENKVENWQHWGVPNRANFEVLHWVFFAQRNGLWFSNSSFIVGVEVNLVANEDFDRNVDFLVHFRQPVFQFFEGSPLTDIEE